MRQSMHSILKSTVQGSYWRGYSTFLAPLRRAAARNSAWVMLLVTLGWLLLGSPVAHAFTCGPLDQYVDAIEGSGPGTFHGEINNGCISGGPDRSDWFSFQATAGASVTVALLALCDIRRPRLTLYAVPNSPPARGDDRTTYTVIASTGPGGSLCTPLPSLTASGLSAGAYVLALDNDIGSGDDGRTNYTLSIAGQGIRATPVPPLRYAFTPLGSRLPVDINNHGQMVGTLAETGAAIVFDRRGAPTLLSVPGSNATRARGINDAGQIVGSFSDARGQNHGFVYSRDSFTTIDVPDPELLFPSTFAEGINNAGEIVGDYDPGFGGAASRGFRYRDGSFSDLSVPLFFGFGSIEGTLLYDINNAGEIVGDYESGQGMRGVHGFVYSGSSFIAIDVPLSFGDVLSTSPTSINDAGQIVGSFIGIFTGFFGRRGFVYSGGSFTSFNVPLSFGATEGVMPTGINNAGEIVGVYYDSTGAHGFLATPCSTTTPCAEETPMITSQFEHGCVVNTDATLWCWGAAASGRLGNGTTAPPQLTPIRVPLTGVAQVDAGIHQTCAVKLDGTAWCWGDGSQYQLGYGGAIGQLLPRQVAGLTQVAEITTNDAFSCARKHDGTAWCWGAGGDGQLGAGGRSTQRTPVQVSQATGLTFVTQLVVSDRHTCAVQDDGTAWCWGANHVGQLGDGTTIRRTLPTRVVGLTEVLQVVAGAHHSCALKLDGTVWCWGEDARGALGNGPVQGQTQLTPVPVAGLSGATWLSAQVWHTCAVTLEGKVWCWGRNNTGQLGDGTTTDRHAPVPVVGLTDMAQVSAGYYASCALKRDGTAWCWGAGGSGRLGNGSTAGSLTPMQVRNIP